SPWRRGCLTLKCRPDTGSPGPKRPATQTSPESSATPKPGRSPRVRLMQNPVANDERPLSHLIRQPGERRVGKVHRAATASHRLGMSLICASLGRVKNRFRLPREVDSRHARLHQPALIENAALSETDM